MTGECVRSASTVSPDKSRLGRGRVIHHAPSLVISDACEPLMRSGLQGIHRLRTICRSRRPIRQFCVYVCVCVCVFGVLRKPEVESVTVFDDDVVHAGRQIAAKRFAHVG
jgi:hypothetical protein